jgi:hypothetical protein
MSEDYSRIAAIAIARPLDQKFRVAPARPIYNELRRCAMRKAANGKTRTVIIRKRSGKPSNKNKLKQNPKSGESVIAGFDAGTGEGSAQVKTFLKNLSTLAKLY